MLNTDEAFTHVTFIKRYPTLLEDRYKHIMYDNPIRTTVGCVFPRWVPSIIFSLTTGMILKRTVVARQQRPKLLLEKIYINS